LKDICNFHFAITKAFFLPLHAIRNNHKNTMEIINLSEKNSIIGQYMMEIRDSEYQKNRLLFRNNIMRIGEFEAFEISKHLNYEEREVATPLGIAKVNVPSDKLVLATIFRAGLPFHQGFLNVFDHAGNAFVSAYRAYKDEEHHEVGIHVEYLATPSIEKKTLIIADPMLATGGSMELGYKAFLTKGTPRRIHVACVIATPEGIDHVAKTLPEEKTTIWCAAIDPGMNEHKYIVPGFGDAGDLCYGDKI
jgi:uracil phosphoribosyltransferase